MLRDIFIRFSTAVGALPSVQNNSRSSLIQILWTSRNAAVKKRATEAIPALIATNPALFDETLKSELLKGLTAREDIGNTWVNLVGALAKEPSVVSKMGATVAEGKMVEELLQQTEDTEKPEAVEAALTAIEALIVRCPVNIQPYIASIVDKSLELIRFDPNYVELSDDDDVDMGDEDEDDEFDDGDYSDEEDSSWKIRRSAAKVLAALIGTRNELLVDFYKSAASVLISRFSEREESVRLEVLAAAESLLSQTVQVAANEAFAAGRNKRKRSQEMDEDEEAGEESAVRYLQQHHAQLLRAILKQLSSKSVATKQECFVLLSQIDEALGGGLENDATPICSAAAAAVQSVDTAASSSLAIAALSFLARFFHHHSARVFASHLDDLVPAIVRCTKNKLQRVSFEAFAATSALAEALRPKGSASPVASNYSGSVRQLFDATMQVLADTSVDGEVRERALSTLGNLLVHEGELLSDTYSQCLPLISSRLAAESTVLTAVNVITRVAESQSCKGPDFEDWLLKVLPEVVVALRKTRRSSSKNAEFACLQAVLTRVAGALPADTADALVAELKAFIDAPSALSTVSLILKLQPSSRRAVETQLLPEINKLASTPSVNHQLVDALAEFYGAFVAGDEDSALRLVPALTTNLSKAANLPDAIQGGTSAYSTTAKCIGAITQSSRRNSAGILQCFQRILQSKTSTEGGIYLSLLCIGEIGRLDDLSGEPQLFEKIISLFDNDSEEVRSAAAAAAGNLAVGSPHVFLNNLVNRLVHSPPEESTRLLFLHALKEVILHLSPPMLEALADPLWAPLFDESQHADALEIGDDGIRNVKAACIGKLTTMAPAKFLPQLQSLLTSSTRNRALVAASVRYTFIDTLSTYDDLVAPVVIDFLSLMGDENLIVRRLSVASLNAAIQNKPHLVKERLEALQPLLYNETLVKPELQREVQMGPWKVVEDDGLENRKTAYETMYTLLGACFSRIDLPAFTDRVMAALKDVNEIKVLGLMLLLRLGQLSPASVIPRLDEAAEALRVIMKDLEVKDDTVKQDLERKEEMQRTTLRTAVPLYKLSSASQAPVFHDFVSGLLARSEWRDFQDYQA